MFLQSGEFGCLCRLTFTMTPEAVLSIPEARWVVGVASPGCPDFWHRCDIFEVSFPPAPANVVCFSPFKVTLDLGCQAGKPRQNSAEVVKRGSWVGSHVASL